MVDGEIPITDVQQIPNQYGIVGFIPLRQL